MKLHYQDEAPQEYSLTSADDVAKYEEYTDGRGYEYAYSYQVNYKGESQRFQSPELTTDEPVLTVNVGDTGILDVELLPGDLDFSQITRARLELRYEDPGRASPPVEHSGDPRQERTRRRGSRRSCSFPSTRPTSYQRGLRDGLGGKDYTVDWRDSRARQLYINDPFADSRTVGIRGFGDFNTRIDTIFLNLRYEDAGMATPDRDLRP